LELSQERFDLVREAGVKWLEWYCALLEKTASEPFNPDDAALMYHVRSRILEFYMLKDRSFQIIQKLGVPLETMTLAHFAPTIHY
jgi:coproporphyrinogen III oxidase